MKTRLEQEKLVKYEKFLPITLSTLNDKLLIPVHAVADGAGRQTCTGSTLCVIILPFTS